ncbi:unnamed protein product [Effrenium voratum]|nr:unnamed protein product [Effrenium voratum]
MVGWGGSWAEVACWAAVPWPSRAIDAEEQKQVRRELAALFHQHYVVPGAGTTAREVRDMAAALRFIRSLRCGEASWCAKAAPLRSLRRSEEEEILQRLHASQNPANCEDARYLVFHDDRTTSGFGWNAFILFSAFLQAFLEERVLVEAAAVSDRDHQRWRQRWCSDPPYSLKCFFRSWSKCERPDLVSKAVPMGLSSLLDWKNAESAGKTNTSCTCNERLAC